MTPRRSAAAGPPIEGPANEERLLAMLQIEANDPSLFHKALTHRSALGDANPSGIPKYSNERLEFLGDAVLGQIVASQLFQRYPEASEGQLTRWRAGIVRAEQLAEWADRISLSSYLLAAEGNELGRNSGVRVKAGAMEALIGAIALDQGLDQAEEFVCSFFEADLDAWMSSLEDSNPKGTLQEITQDLFRLTPIYVITAQEGPAHERWFTVQVALGSDVLGQGSGSTKRTAEEAAARAALQSRGEEWAALQSERDETP